ncbi:MAG TPA: DNA replication and repair protein RecF, partial [Bacteroidia bacterium]|nr:DNA replication and repair protein RecF [Bacteroidia bacterium]
MENPFSGMLTAGFQCVILAMFLKELCLIDFRNYQEVALKPGPGINCFTGDNGSGKTNLLDAIHYLSLCKSYFNPVDSQNIRHDAPFFVIQGRYEEQGREEAVYCGVKRGHKKVFKRNDKEYERLAEHIGKFPLVMISPADAELVTEGSEPRRRFLDSVISQYDRTYLEKLILYNRALSQRNALLKKFKQSGTVDTDSLDIWDEQLMGYGQPVFEVRRQFTAGFVPIFREFYALLSSGKEEVELTYRSDLHTLSFREMLDKALQRDLAVEHSTAGIHRDDLEFMMNGYALKKDGSQGQQKTFLLALKLAQFEFIRNQVPGKEAP